MLRRDYSDKHIARLTAAIVLGVIAILLSMSWIMTRGVADDTDKQPTPQNIPVNTNSPGTGTGGSSGVGTGANNDVNETVPGSPAGGVDTNQAPSGSTPPN